MAETVIRIVIAIAIFLVIMRVGIGMLRMLARPVPEPPPAGELRKVKRTYRCALCGTEVKMTLTDDPDPDPPRHCMEEMELITPVEDLE